MRIKIEKQLAYAVLKFLKISACGLLVSDLDFHQEIGGLRCLTLIPGINSLLGKY
jgi:hypothetical protein